MQHCIPLPRCILLLAILVFVLVGGSIASHTPSCCRSKVASPLYEGIAEFCPACFFKNDNNYFQLHTILLLLVHVIILCIPQGWTPNPLGKVGRGGSLESVDGVLLGVAVRGAGKVWRSVNRRLKWWLGNDVIFHPCQVQGSTLQVQLVTAWFYGCGRSRLSPSDEVGTKWDGYTICTPAQQFSLSI